MNALLSRSLGEKKFKEADRAANMGFLLMLISYVAFAVFMSGWTSGAAATSSGIHGGPVARRS